jgi:uncharacterized membrane protein
MRMSLVALLAAVALAAFQLWHAVPQLPETVATHFGLRGEADGWSSRESFVLFAAILVLAFAGLPVAINWMVARLPPSLINIPHREYWLSEERRGTTLRQLRGSMEWFGVISVAFAIAINHATIRANLEALRDGGPARLGGTFGWALGLYLVATGVWVVWLLRQFRVVQSDREAPSALRPR